MFAQTWGERVSFPALPVVLTVILTLATISGQATLVRLSAISIGPPLSNERLSTGWDALPVAARGPVATTLGSNDSEYAVRRQGFGLRAVNKAHGLDIRFDVDGVHVSTGADGLGLTLSALGYGEVLRAVPAVRPIASANRVEYGRPGLVEWYANGPLGLEQGFTIAHPPAGSGQQLLTLSLTLAGDLPASLASDGQSASFGRLAYRGLVVSDAVGRALPARLELRGREMLIRVDDRGAQYPVVVDPFIQQAKLTAADAGANDYLGGSIAISGDTIVAGAYGDDIGSTTDQGSAYVFVKPSGGWANATHTAKLTATDGGVNDMLGYSVAISGDTIAVGAYQYGTGPDDTGAVYVFVKPSGGWVDATQTAKLKASDAAPSVRMGTSVAMSGDTIVAGASGDNFSRGAVYVFVKPSGSWVNATETAKLTASDRAAEDWLGSDVSGVAIDGDTIAAGAFKDDVSFSDQGSVYVFVKPGGGWTNATQTAKLTASDAAAGDYLGLWVAVSGDTIVAGAYSADIGANLNQGAAYVFVKPLSGWANSYQTAKLTASDGAANDYFGYSVAIASDTIAVGAVGDDVGTNGEQGSVYRFVKPGDGWVDATEADKITAPDGEAADQLGVSVRLSGDMLLSGANSDDIEVASQGSVYVFAPSDPPNNPPAGTDKTVTMAENGSYAFTTADFGFDDPDDDPADALMAVKIATLPGAGSLTNDATPVAANDSITAADITAGKLVFTPAAGGSGSPYTSFTFQVQDDGGTDNGGVDLDQSANTMTIDVTAAASYQPDGAIRRSGGPRRGNDIYNTDGAGQTFDSGSRRYRAGAVRWLYVYLQNDGDSPDRLTVAAGALGPSLTANGYNVRYFTPGLIEITAAVEAGTFTTALIQPGQRSAIRVRIEITAAAAHHSEVSRLLTITSTSDVSKEDAVGFIVRRR